MILQRSWDHTNDPVPLIRMEYKPGVARMNLVFDSNGLYSYLHSVVLIITLDQALTPLTYLYIMHFRSFACTYSYVRTCTVRVFPVLAHTRLYVRAPFKFPQLNVMCSYVLVCTYVHLSSFPNRGGGEGCFPIWIWKSYIEFLRTRMTPGPFFFLVNLDGLEIWSMLDLVTWKVSESGIGPPFGGCTCPCKEMERVKIVLQCKI